jgi:8-hydroxy-5-deazaflavin:NADPH oxidoreductase
MRIGVLGTGVVGQTLATKLVSLGHEVKMGSRQAGNEKALEWAGQAGAGASEGSFADAAEHGELVINATAGAVAVDALRMAGADNLAGKVLSDVSNPLDFSRGMPPTLTVCNDDSVAEQIQREFPDARVVKSLNTVNTEVMVTPEVVPGEHTMFVAGDDEDAKRQVKDLLETLGWARDRLFDLGDLTAARGMEMYLPLWLRMFGVAGTGRLNIHVVIA